MSMFFNNEPFDVKWLVLEKYVDPWIKGPLLEPILGRAIDFKRRALSQVSKGHHPSRIEVMRLIKDGILISEDLDATAINVKASLNPDLPSHQQLTAFNDMFELSTQTNEVIARSLYHTVRYHVFELVSRLVGLVEEGDGTHHAPGHQFDPSMRFIILEQVCEEICAILGPDSEHSMEEYETGMAYRAYSMFWPLIVLLSSSLVGEETITWAQEKLRFMGEKSELRLATFAASNVNMLRPA